MDYTEEDVRNAFQAGQTKGKHNSYFDAPLDEDEYVAELNQTKKNNGEECSHPFHAVRTNKITDLNECTICEKKWY